MATQIKADALIADFRHMLDNKWGYIFGASGQVLTQEEYEKKAAKNEWTKKYGKKWIGHHVADCSGAFVWAYKQHGRSIYHGVNRIAREYVVELLPVSAAEPGMAAFKVYKPGHKNYDLPDDCKPGHAHYNGDLNDYHHIGLVDGDPSRVLEAATTQIGVRLGKLADNWDYVARLKSVQYEGGDEPVATEKQMIVTAKNGNTVNLRCGPGSSYSVMRRVPVGSVVDQITTTGKWAFVRYLTETGYMKSDYLIPADNAQTPDTGQQAGQDAPPDEPARNIMEQMKAAQEAAETALRAAQDARDAVDALAALLISTGGENDVG